MGSTTTSSHAQELGVADDALDAAILDTLITEHPAQFSYQEIVRHFSTSRGLN